MKTISILLLGLILVLSGVTAEAKGGHGGGRTNYGGTYKNSKTSDQYGKHKD